MHTQAVDRARRSFPDTGSAPGSSLSHLDPARPPGASGRSGRKPALSSGGTWPPPPRCPELASPTRGVPRRPASSISVLRSSFPVPPPGGPLAPRDGPRSPGPGRVLRRAAFLRLLLSLSVPSACWPSEAGTFSGWSGASVVSRTCRLCPVAVGPGPAVDSAAGRPCGPWTVPDTGRRRRRPAHSSLPEPQSCVRDPS